MKYLSYLILSVIFLVACSKQSRLEYALELAGNNRKQLEEVLDHYSKSPKDSLKYKAACFLIENMIYHYSFEGKYLEYYYASVDSIFAIEENENEKLARLVDRVNTKGGDINVAPDIENITASYLISHIDKAFNTLEFPWCKNLEFENFCEFVLPYRIGNEPLEDWISIYQKRVSISDSLISQNNDSIVSDYLVSYMKPASFQLTRSSFKLDIKASSLLNMTVGSCNNLSALGLYTMRSFGIPAKWDYTPQWANRKSGHDWSSIEVSGKQISFQIDDNVPFGEHLKSKSNDKLAKIYRKMFSAQNEALAMQDIKEEIPPFFKNPLIKDVTHLYFDCVDIDIELIPSQNKIAYICVFDNQKWIPIHWGYVKNGKAQFTKMLKDCVYSAQYYKDKTFYPASDPFYIDPQNNNLLILTPNKEHKAAVTLKRKYPDNDRGVLTVKIPDSKLQIAMNSNFSDAITVYTSDTLTENRPQYIKLNKPIKGKYFRYQSHHGHVFIAEIEVYNNSNEKIKGSVIGTEGSYDNLGRDKYNAFDGNPLTYVDTPVSDGWVGLAFDKAEQIQEIMFLPRNDDNYIKNKELYELFYYDKGWISMGTMEGDKSHALVYNNVPDNALLLLKNHTIGIEERIFTYKNEKQVWW